jgi:glyoxylate reductase
VPNWNVYVTRLIPEEPLALLREGGCEVEVSPHDRFLTREELLAAVIDRDGFIPMVTDRIDEAVMRAAHGIKGIANFGVGYNNIDIDKATELGLPVTNTPDVLTDATADLAWALLFAAARGIVENDGIFRSGSWDGWGPLQFLGMDVTGRTLGVVGAGRIGENFALKSAGFKMPVLYADSKPNATLEEKLGARRVELSTLLRESDFVSLHVPLTPEIQHLIGAKELELMKPSAVLINTSRGPVVDEAALVDALRSKQIASAALDVYENEPTPAPGLINLPQVVCLPHIGSATRSTRTNMGLIAAQNMLQILRGERPDNLVNPTILDK